LLNSTKGKTAMANPTIPSPGMGRNLPSSPQRPTDWKTICTVMIIGAFAFAGGLYYFFSIN
jgi:hypothetical protein